MSKNKRKGFLAGYKKSGPVARFTIRLTVIGLILGSLYFIITLLFGASRSSQEIAMLDREKKHQEEMQYLEKIPKLYDSVLDIKAKFTDEKMNKLENFKDIEVLEQKIISAQKGYLKIRVKKNYLNHVFDDFITLSYEYEKKYQPMMLTFVNDLEWGAGVIFNSPEYQNRAEVYLNKCFRYSGGGKMTYTEDLIFQLYYNDFCIYLTTNSGAIKFEHSLPPIRYGWNNCIGYFDESNKKRNATASQEYVRLRKFFNNL